MHINSKAMTLTAIAASAAVAGCGGGSKSAEAQANDVCKNYNAKLSALPKPRALADLKTFIASAAPLIDQGTAKLQAIKPPSGKATAWNAWIATLNQQVAVVKQAKAQSDSGNIAQAVALVRQQAPLSDKSRAQAKALGVGECAK